MGRIVKAAKIMASVCMVAGMALYAGTALGADSSVIETMTVTFKSSYGEPSEMLDPEVTLVAKGGSLGEVQYMTDYERWVPGKKVRVELTVNADAGKYFPTSMNRTACKVTGADFVSAKALDNSTFQVRVDYRPVTVLASTENAGWHSNNRTRAIWKSVAYAPGYSLTLYGDNKALKRMTVETNYVDLAEYMEDVDKTYYYEVKAVPLTADEKKYLKEGELSSSSDRAFDWEPENAGGAGGGSAGTPTSAGDGGSLKGESYVMPDGSKAYNSWKLLSGKWYYFDGAGNRVKGWFSNGGKWYYMDQDGVMLTGWVDLGGSRFYLGEFGDMLTGWIQPVPGTWYYLNPSGYMERGWANVAGKWYYLEQDGRMKVGWLKDNGRWYYLTFDGSMAVDTMVDSWQIGADGVASGRS